MINQTRVTTRVVATNPAAAISPVLVIILVLVTIPEQVRISPISLR